jgi:hypothetical protein
LKRKKNNQNSNDEDESEAEESTVKNQILFLFFHQNKTKKDNGAITKVLRATSPPLELLRTSVEKPGAGTYSKPNIIKRTLEKFWYRGGYGRK